MVIRNLLATAIALVACAAQAGTQTRTSAFEYDAATGLMTKEIIEPGDPALCVVTTYAYDTFGNRTSATTRNCNGSSSEAGAPAAGSAAVIVSRQSNTAFAATTANPVAGQFPTSLSNALAQTETKQYDPRFGGVTKLTGPNLLDTNWTYDTFGRKTSETRPDGTVSSWFYERCVDVAGACPSFAQYRVRVTTTGAPTSSTYYDSLGREVRGESQGFDGTLVRRDTQYDALGRVAQVSRPYYAGATPVWTVFTTYDALSRVVQVDEPPANPGEGHLTTVTTYSGLVTTVTVSNGGSGTGMPGAVSQAKTTTRNAQGQVVQVKDTQNNLLTYTYDEFGNLKTTTDALSNITTLSYDTRGRKIQMVDPDMGTWSYGYDVLGQLVSQTDAKGQAVSTTYDVLGRMVGRSEPDLVSTWTYDSCAMGTGKLCSATATNSYSRSFTYDSKGRPQTLNVTIDTAYAVTTTYVSAGPNVGKVDTVTYPTGFAVKNNYNAYGYLSSVQRADAGGSNVFWTANAKNAGGQVTSESLGNALTQTRTFDALDRLTSVVASGLNGPVHSFAYSYDTIGNVLTRADNVDAVSETFAYDTLNRLLSASGPGVVTRSFNYDAIGNMIYKSDVGAYTYPVSGAGSVRPHAVSGVTGSVNTTYVYDANGNLSSGAGRTLTYASFNMPATIVGAAATYTYTYNPEHQRVRLDTHLQTGTQTSIYLHPGGAGALFYEKEIKADSTIENKHYVQAGSILVGVYVTKSAYAQGDGPQMRYYHRDHVGSIAAITNDAGAVLERLAYEAFGKRRFPNGTADPASSLFGITTDRGFTAHEHLDELGLIHMNGRVYDPLLGRFMTADLLIEAPANLQSYNRYSYVWNNPFGATDPTGHSRWTRFRDKAEHAAVATAAVVAVTYAASQIAAAMYMSAPMTIAVVAATAIAASISAIQGGNPGQIMVAGAFGGIAAGVGGAAGTWAAGAFGSGMAGGLVGGAVGGGTNATLYWSTGAPVDIGQAIAAGAVGGLVGAGFQIHTGIPMAGTVAGGYAAAAMSGGNRGKGALYGFFGGMVTAGTQMALDDGSGEVLSKSTQTKKGEVLYLKPDPGARLLALIQGDGEFTHAMISKGDGTYIDANLTSGEREFGVMSTDGRGDYGRTFVRGPVTVDVAQATTHEGEGYGILPDQKVCTTLVTDASHGAVQGFAAGQQFSNSGPLGGYRPEYIYFNLAR